MRHERTAVIWRGLAMMVAIGCVTPRAGAEAVTKADDRPLYAAVDALHHTMTLRGIPADPLAMIHLLGSAPCAAAGTVEEKLAVIARDQGAAAVALRGLTLDELASAAQPLVLKVRATPESKAPDHYVVCESVSDGAALIYAGPGPVIKLPVEALAWYWGGEAVAVTGDGLPGGAGNIAYRRGHVWWGYGVIGVMCVVVLSLRWRSREPGRGIGWGRAAVQGAGLIIVAAILGFVAQGLYSGARLRQAEDAVAQRGTVLVNFYDPREPVTQVAVHNVGADEFRRKLKGDRLLLDVRSAGQYHGMHVAGAVSAPDLNERAMRLRLAGVPKDKPLLVYCADVTCPRGRVACGILQRLGFTDVVHYPEGWKDLKEWPDLSLEKSDGAAPPP